MQLLNALIIIPTIMLAGHLSSQRIIPAAEFDSVYNLAISSINTDRTAARSCLDTLISYRQGCSPVQKAKIGFLRFRVIRSDKAAFEALENRMFRAPDSLGPVDSLLYSSGRYLKRSMPDKAIPLLLQAIELVPEDSDKAGCCIINLCEAYREKQEYAKGISMLNELLAGKSALSDENGD